MRQFLAVTFILGLLAVPTVWFLDPGSVAGVVAAAKPAPEPVASRPLMSDEDKLRVREIARGGDSAEGAHAMVEAMNAVAAGLAEALPHDEPGDESAEQVLVIDAYDDGATNSPDLAADQSGIAGGSTAVASLVGDLPEAPAEGQGATASTASSQADATAPAAAPAVRPDVPVVVMLRHRPLAMAAAGPAWLVRAYPTSISWYDLV